MNHDLKERWIAIDQGIGKVLTTGTLSERLLQLRDIGPDGVAPGFLIEVLSGMLPELIELTAENSNLLHTEASQALLKELAALKAERKEIEDYLWPNQTGLPNEHRNCFIAIRRREELLLKEINRHIEASRQAMERWHAAHPGWTNTSPTEVDLMVWQAERLEAEGKRAEEAEAQIAMLQKIDDSRCDEYVAMERSYQKKLAQSEAANAHQVSELTKALDAYEEQVQGMEADTAKLKDEAYNDGRNTQAILTGRALDSVIAEKRAEFESKLQACRAEAAAMRQALMGLNLEWLWNSSIKCAEFLKANDAIRADTLKTEYYRLCEVKREALSGTAGQSLLKELEKLKAERNAALELHEGERLAKEELIQRLIDRTSAYDARDGELSALRGVAEKLAEALTRHTEFESTSFSRSALAEYEALKP